jgi:hypothetical protein
MARKGATEGLPLLLAFAKAAEIVRNRLFISRWDRGFFGGTHLARRLVVGIVAQLELQFVDAAKHLSVELLHHRRIAGEPAWIQPLHLLSQLLNFLERRRIILGQMVKLVQLRQALAVSAFRVGRHG